MKSAVSSIPILVLVLIPPFFYAQSSKPESARNANREIASLEDRWLEAVITSDAAALDSILGDDFLRPVPAAGRFVTKSQLLEYYKSQKPASSAPKHIENLNVTLYGAAAIARGNVVTTDVGGHVVAKNLFTDVFVLRDGRWQAVSAQENETSNR